MNDISADSTTLMRQAPMTATEYMDAGIEAIDGRFGKGYAQANPVLLAGFIQAAAMDFGASLLSQQVQQLGNMVSYVGRVMEEQG